MKDRPYIPYQEIAEILVPEKGGIFWLAADLTRLAFTARRKEGEFEALKFIQGFCDRLGDEGTLVIPSFNYNLRSGDHFSPASTMPVTGALATEALRSGKFTRTAHPVHSFLVCGKETQTLAALTNKSSFGPDSPFHFFHIYHGKMAILGTSIAHAFTFVHYVEEELKVKYRKYHKINIYNKDSQAWADYAFFAKKRGWTMDMAGLEQLLLQHEVAKAGEVNGIPYAVVDLAGAYALIQNDIAHNHARNIAHFSFNIYLRSLIKDVLAPLGFRTASDKISHDTGL